VQNNRLVGGVRTFPNGDKLIVGPRNLRGFLARGTYQMAAPLTWVQVALVLGVVCTNLAVYAMIAVEFSHLAGRGHEMFVLPCIIFAAYCIVIQEAGLFWTNERRVAALLQWAQFTMLSDSYQLLVHARTHGVIADIRNNAPVFGLESMMELKDIHGMHAAMPMTYACRLHGRALASLGTYKHTCIVACSHAVSCVYQVRCLHVPDATRQPFGRDSVPRVLLGVCHIFRSGVRGTPHAQSSAECPAAQHAEPTRCVSLSCAPPFLSCCAFPRSQHGDA